MRIWTRWVLALDLGLLPRDDVTLKVKCYEWARPAAYPRAIGDYGTDQSLVFSQEATRVKKAMGCHYTSDDLSLQYVSNGVFDVPVFSDLLNSDRRCTAIYFSDDMCLRVLVGNGVNLYNVDISACDASHTSFIVNCVHHLIKGIFDTRHLKVLRNRLKIKYGHNHRVYIEPKDILMYSGTTWTTIMNNVASCLIVSAIYDMLERQNYIYVDSDIVKCVERIGYKIKLQRCSTVQQLQFLKCSPTAHGEPFVNPSCLMRSLGCSDGSTLGKLTTHRMNTRVSSVIKGFPQDTGPISAAFRRLGERLSTHDTTEIITKEYIGKSRTITEVTMDDLVNRYDCSPSLIEDFCSEIDKMSGRQILCHPFVYLCLYVDYGFDLPGEYAWLNSELGGDIPVH